MSNGKITGSVKFYNPNKGFGFISPDGGGADIFVHVTSLKASNIETLKEGDVVSFTTEPDPRKPGKAPVAVNLKLEHANLAAD